MHRSLFLFFAFAVSISINAQNVNNWTATKVEKRWKDASTGLWNEWRDITDSSKHTIFTDLNIGLFITGVQKGIDVPDYFRYRVVDKKPIECLGGEFDIELIRLRLVAENAGESQNCLWLRSGGGNDIIILGGDMIQVRYSLQRKSN